MKTLLLICTFCFSLNLLAQAPTGYYNRAEGLEGFALKTALFNIIDDEIKDNLGQPAHQPKSYGALFDVYETADRRPDGFVWDMYSDCNFVFGDDQDMGSSGTQECQVFNREHSFPRSWFGGNENLAIFTDPFHVIPADKKVNSERGNLAYGNVDDSVTPTYISRNGSRIGQSTNSNINADVFEPIDEFKGDIARQLFYVATRYEDMIEQWETNNSSGNSMLDGSADRVFEDWALQVLFEWHTADPVSEKELQRQEAIFDFQSNRNPFIDHPEWVGEIWAASLNVQDIVASNFTMYPNPAEGKELHINFDSATPTTISIYSVLGRRVGLVSTSLRAVTLDISKLKTGLYVVRIERNNTIVSKKLIRS